MIKHVFSPEMMQERERQLILALLDCAGVYYDVNFTQDRIIGCPIQMVDGEPYDILKQIGKEENCTYSEIIDYWMDVMPQEERDAFVEFSNVERIKARYEAGERLLSHRFWTSDVCGNPMLAHQKTRLYKDTVTGDILGLTYVSNDKEQDTWKKKEKKLSEQYQEAMDEVLLMEEIGENVPGGYHRCSTTGGFKLEFVSKSFLDVVGWTKEELEQELNNDYIELVAPEDREHFMSYEPALQRDGRVELVYRIRRKDGTRRWIQDATTKMEHGGKEFFQCALLDITEHVEMLNKEKERAEMSNRAKSTFLFNASHDIRTPMNAILGFAHILEDNYDNPQMVQKTVQKIIQSGNTLMTLLNDVLELSRIEQGKDDIDERVLDMNEHVQKLYEMFVTEVEASGIQFYMNNDIKHQHVLGDVLKLSRIALNLLSNAKKFTPKGGTITFGVYETDATEETAVYNLFVKDTGIGMSKEFQGRAFEQFERERSSTESGVSGSGLGLAIIKSLCDLMHGTCRIESELGQGTQITVSVPLKLAKETIEAKGKEYQEADFGGKRVLLVEDNDFNREIARYMLEMIHIEVEEAEDGSVCVNKVLNAAPGYYDLILMDIQMPVMDGFRATQEIRNIKDERIASVPILAMTANAFVEDQQKCIAAGMNGHLAKPLDVSALLKMLTDIWNK